MQNELHVKKQRFKLLFMPKFERMLTFLTQASAASTLKELKRYCLKRTSSYSFHKITFRLVMNISTSVYTYPAFNSETTDCMYTRVDQKLTGLFK